jgi:hypothetical protein
MTGGGDKCRNVTRSVPRSLYKYMPYKGRSRAYLHNLICRRRLKFAYAGTYNDPFEGRPNITWPNLPPLEKRQYVMQFFNSIGAAEDTKLLAAADPEALIRDFEMAIRQVVSSQVLVSCLAGTRRSILMWSHYADEHHGVCVHVAGRIEPMLSAHPVDYCEQYPTIRSSEWQQQPNDLGFTRRCILTKAPAWSYEREFRLVAPVEDGQNWEITMDGQVGILPEGSITGITLGARIADADAHRLAMHALNRGVPVWRARLSETDYRLTYERVRRTSSSCDPCDDCPTF